MLVYGWQLIDSIPSGNEAGGLYIGTNSVSTFAPSSARRRYDLTWIPAAQRWQLCVYSLAYQNALFTAYGKKGGSGTMPRDFLPEIDPPAQLLSSPSLQSLRPSLSSSAPLALDADPATLEGLAPEDFIDEDFTDPDALDDAEDDALPTLDEEA